MEVTLFGNAIDASELHPSNAISSISVTPSGITTVSNEVQSLNVPTLIEATPNGIVTDFRFV